MIEILFIQQARLLIKYYKFDVKSILKIIFHLTTQSGHSVVVVQK